MGCGASAARAVESPHVAAASLAPPARADTKEEPPEAHSDVAGPAAAVAAEPDELEGLLAALEEPPEQRSSRGEKPPTQPQDAGSGPRPEGALRSGDLEQLLRELQGEAPEGTVHMSTTPTAPTALPAPLAALTPLMPAPGPVRQLAPLKISGRMAIAPSLAPAPAVLLPHGSPAAGKLGVSPPTSGGMRNGAWAASGAAELEPPDSATLLSIDHRGGRGSASRTSSMGSPSTASTTYITFDLLPDGDRTSARDGEGEGSLGQGRVTVDGPRGAAHAGGREEPLWRGGARGGGDGLERKAAEVDELLRDVFEDPGGGQPRGGAGAEGARNGAEGREAKGRGNDSSSSGRGKLHARTERPSGNSDKAGRSSHQAGTATPELHREGAAVASKPAPHVAEEVPSTSGWQSRMSGGMGGSVSNQIGLLDNTLSGVDGASREKEAGRPLESGERGIRESPRVWERREAGGEEGRREAGADILDLDDLEDIARDEDAAGGPPEGGVGKGAGEAPDRDRGSLQHDLLQIFNIDGKDYQDDDDMERWPCQGRRSSSSVEPGSAEDVLEVDMLELEGEA